VTYQRPAVPVRYLDAEPAAATGPGVYDLSIYRGDNFGFQVVLWEDPDKTTPVDLTGATAKAEIRDNPGGVLSVAFVCTITPPNTVALALDAAAAAMVRAGVWDLQITRADGWISTVLGGAVELTPDVTDSTPSE
jgi:hypothetical protein